MVDRFDLFIAVAAVVATVVGSSTAQWVAVSKKADKDDLRRLEARMDDGFGRLEARFDLQFDRLENKVDALILRLVPEQLPPPEN